MTNETKTQKTLKICGIEVAKGNVYEDLHGSRMRGAKLAQAILVCALKVDGRKGFRFNGRYYIEGDFLAIVEARSRALTADSAL